VVAHRRSPANATGTLLVAAAAAWVGEVLAIARPSVLFTVGQVLTMVTTPVLAHLALAFPEGRLATSGRRRLVAVAWVVAIGFPLLTAPFQGVAAQLAPRVNLLLWRNLGDVARGMGLAGQVAQAAVAIAVAWLMVRRTARASPLLRRVLLPPYLAGWALGALALVDAVLAAAGQEQAHLLMTRYAMPGLWLVLPMGYLIGVYRSTWRAPDTPIVARLGPGTTVPDLADRLREAVGDPSLDLLAGPSATAFEPDPARTTTPVTVDGTTIGAIVHDPALLESPRRMAALTQAAAWGLQAIALRDGTDEEVAGRLAQASAAARHRLERDLHDGAQQQLLAVALQLSLLEDELGGTAGSAASRLGAATRSLDSALEDLRSLARGLPPPLLASAGLGPALRALAERTSPPVEARIPELPELPAPVEATVWFAAAEALANVSRHARANAVLLVVDSVPGRLRLTVEDDGVGGADPLGSGLLGIRGRAAMADGTLEVGDRPGGGTAFVLTVPVAGHG
jgi:signal transduction histidine kinase